MGSAVSFPLLLGRSSELKKLVIDVVFEFRHEGKELVKNGAVGCEYRISHATSGKFNNLALLPIPGILVASPGFHAMRSKATFHHPHFQHRIIPSCLDAA